MSPYPKTLGSEIQDEIEPYTRKMKEMKGGTSFTLTTPEEASKLTEYWLRCFLHTEGYPKGTFRISRENPSTIRILKRFGAQTHLKEDSKGKGTAFVLDNLLEIQDEPKAIAILQEAREAGKLSSFELLDALREWRKVMGKEEER